MPSRKFCYKQRSFSQSVQSKCFWPFLDLVGFQSAGCICRTKQPRPSLKVMELMLGTGRNKAKALLGSLIPELAPEHISPRHNTVQAQALYLSTKESLSTISSTSLLCSRSGLSLRLLRKAVPAALGWDVQGGCHPCRVPDPWPGALCSSNDGKWSTKGLHAATQPLPLSRTGFAGLTDPKPQGLGQNTSLRQSTAKAMTRFAKNSLIINFNRVTCSTYLCFNYYASPLLLCWVEPILFSIRTLDEDELKPVIPNLAQNKIFSVLVHILMC